LSGFLSESILVQLLLFLFFVVCASNLNVVCKHCFDYGDEGHFQPSFERTPVTTVGFQRPISSNLPVAPISGDL